MNVIETLRLAAARSAVLHQYALAHDSWAEQEQLLTLEGRDIEAAGCHEFALRVLRAWLAESDNPVPEGLER